MKWPGKSSSHKKHVRDYAALRPMARFAGISPRDLLVSVGPIIVITALVIGAAFWIVRPAPPDHNYCQRPGRQHLSGNS
jgi:hypothetical protein